MTGMVRLHAIRTAIEICLFVILLFLLGALPGLLADQDSTVPEQIRQPQQ
jgi:hypothetical protein